MADIDKGKQMNCGAIMSLKDVGIRIGRKDNECIKKWLNQNGITIHRLGKLICIYKIDFDCAMLLPHIRDYKRQYPTQWEAYYQKTIKDEALFNLIMLKLQVDISYKPTTKVKRSKKDEELYQKLMS